MGTARLCPFVLALAFLPMNTSNKAHHDAPPQTVEFVRHDMGLDQPLPVQYGVWLGHILRGDLGKSVFSKLPVSQLIGQRAPATLELALVGELLTIVIALPLGVTAAIKQRTATDWTISSATSLGLAIPNFWLGILLITFGVGFVARGPSLTVKPNANADELRVAPEKSGS